MVKRILRRTLILCMILLMVMVSLPVQEAGVYADTNLNTGVEGLTASYDEGTWNGNGTSITGSVKTTSSSGCMGDSYSAQTGKLTLKNTKGETALLTFNYSATLNGGSLNVDGQAVGENGSFSKVISNNSTVIVEIKSSDSAENQTTINITNLALEKKTVTTTFTPSVNGSYTVDGTSVTEDIVKSQDLTTPYSVAATPSAGYKFAGWYDVTHDTYLDTTTPTNLYVTEDATITAVFISSDTAMWEVGTKTFFDLNEAISYASSSNTSTITLLGEGGTLRAGNYTIPSGKTVLIPFDSYKTIYRETPVVVYNEHSTPTAFSTLIMAEGANITVQNGGALAVPSKLSSQGQMGGWNGTPTGPGGRINMLSGSNITLSSGANLYCWGYIYGDGLVTANSGSTVYEAFQIKDWRGGTATSKVYSYAFIFNQYYIQNIEVPLRINAGATEKLYSSVNASSSAYTMAATLVGNGGMFNISSGYLVKDYIEATDRLSVDIHGNASITPMTLTGLPMIGSVSTGDYILPITSNLSIDIQSGTTNVTQNIELLPGVEVKTEKNATFKIDSGKSVYIYDNDDWKNFSGTTRMYAIGYSVANGTTAKRSAASLTDALLDVNGNVNVAGGLYTSLGGANITSSEKTGTVTLTKAPSGDTSINEMENNSTKTSVTFNPARLHNGDNSYTVTAESSAGSVFFYCSAHDKWEKDPHYVITLNPNGGEGTAVTLNFCPTGGNLPANTFTREDYEFDGWNTKKDGTGTAYADEAEIVPTANVTLYAQWVEKACEHHLVKTEAKAATCTEPGNSEYWTCDKCGRFYSDEEGTTEIEENSWVIAAPGHDYVHHEAQAATCTEIGWNAYDTCTRCDYTTYVEIPAKGHTPGEAVIENAVGATCTEAGSYDEVVYCTVCGAELEREHKTTEALGHTLTATPAVAPTCTEAGNSAYWTCSVCGKYFSDAQGTTEIEENSWVISAKGHTWNEGEITTEPTCIEAGVKTFTCSVCDATRTESVAALGHNLTHTAAVDATCTEAGNIEHWTCDRCGNHFSDAEATTVILATSIVIPAKGHTPGEAVQENVVGATCTEAGTYDEVVYCTVCGAELEREHKTTEALGHAWDEGVVTTEPTCTVEGVKTFTCTRCGETKTEAVEALGHDLVHHDAQAATCTEHGWDAYDTCSRCDYTTYEEIAALGHDYVHHDAQAATCTEVGWDAYDTCSRCDYTTYEEIAALGHDIVHHNAQAATCTEIGWKAYDTCSRCDYTTYEEIAALGHDYVHHEAQAATCTEHGWEAYDTCSRCDYTTYVEIPAKGHTPGEVVQENIVGATCTAVGSYDEVVYCTTCGAELEREHKTTEALGHAWDEGKVTTEPTCTVEGEKTFTCTRCGETKTEAVEALGHDLIHHDAQAATCTEHGWNAYDTCSRCDYTTYEEIEALDHDLIHHDAQAATCTEHGWEAYDTCSRCDYTTYKEIAALGHDYVHHDAQAATCTEIGWNAYDTCSRCDYTTYEEIAALGHDYVHHEAQAATCTEIGWNAYDTCSRCDYTTYVEIPAKGHTPGEAVIENAVAATCTEAGSYDEVVYCAVCGAELEREHKTTEALGHTLTATPAVAATCTEAGNSAYWTCSVCGKYFSDAQGTTEIEENSWVIPAKGHTWNEGEITTEPTCIEAGVKTFTCSVCDATRTESVAALGHNLTHTAAVDATCTEAGNIEHWTCDRCGNHFSDAEAMTVILATSIVIPAKGHTPGEAVQENVVGATCTEAGTYDEVVYCTVCDAELEREHKTTEALGHAWDEGVVTTEPTCTVEGVKTFTCTRCGETKTEAVEALGHDLVHHDAQAATCTEAGWDAYDTCSRCDYTTYEEIAALGHAWDEGVVTTQPTCTEAGVKTFTCERCDATRTEEVAALGHDLKATVAKDPTCTEAGNIAYWTCDRCHEIFSDAEGKTEITLEETVIKALGHAWDEGVVTTQPTCTETGVKTFTCQRCDATRTEEVAALGHDLIHHDAKAATCTEAGNSEYWTCERCGKFFSDAEGKNEITLEDTVIPAAGHKWNEGEITTEPTCTEEGVKTFTCTVCGETRTETVAALGHNLTKTEAKAATCTEPGNTEYWTCDRCGKYFSDAEGKNEITLEDTVIPAAGHKWNEGEITTEPTCTEEGVKTFTCTVCGETRTETVAALGHNLTKTEAKAATCTEPGNTEYWTCDRCGKFFSDAEGKNEITLEDTVIPAAGHKWNEGEITTEPTCAEEGVKTFTCTVCGETRTETVAALGHNLTKTEAKAATCTEPGNTEYWTCDRCGKYFSDAEGADEIEKDSWIIPATGHKYGEPTYTWAEDKTTVTATAVCENDPNHVVTETVETTSAVTTPATCEGTGVRTYTAKFENELFTTQNDTEVIPATGHKYGEPTYEWSADKATVTATAVCENDPNHVVTETAETTSAVTTPATCEGTGVRTYTAEFENELFATQTDTEVIPATGHKYGEPTYEWSADKSTVTATAVCANDETHVVTETVETTSAVTTPATCEGTGVRTYTAEFENELFATQTDTEVIPATGHTWDEGNITTEPTCTETGVKTFTCTVCGETRTETVAALGHDLTKTEAKAATCTEAGNSVYWTCDRCGQHFSDEECTTAIAVDSWIIPAIGHDYGEPTYTWSDDNSEVAAVTICKHNPGHIVTEEVNTTFEDTVVATCEGAGTRVYTATFTKEQFTTQTRTVEMPAIGHNYGEPTYTWADDKSTVTATAVCKNDPTHVVTETVNTTSQTTAATCETAGSTVYTADFANVLFEEQTTTVTIPATGHDYDEPTYAWADDKSTVTATAVCKNDHTHVVTETVNTTKDVVPATCEQAGSTTYTAEFENEMFETQTLVLDTPAIGHLYGEPTYTWSDDKTSCVAQAICKNDATHVLTETATATSDVTTEPTCETAGERTYTAEFENSKFETQTIKEVIPANGHTLVATAAVAPTCTETGNSAYWTCSVCGKHFSDAEGTTEIAADSWILPAEGHTLVATAAVAPSCTEAGNSAYWTCSVCGKHFSDAEGTTEIAADSWIIPAAGHIWDNGQVVTPATCTAEGQMLYTCTVCGTTRTEVIAKLPHTIREVAAVAPTCTLPGNSTYYVCDSCGHFFSDAEGTTEIAQDSWVIQANGHTWGEWVVITAPDCVNQGSEQRTCTVCGATESQNLDPNGHTWDEEFTVDQEPTCTTDGSKSRHCHYCDQKTDVTVIPALGHDWDTENVVFTWSDDLSEAEATFTCKRDHTHVETLKAAVTTETAAGIITYTATVVFEDATYTDTKTADAHEVIRIFGQNRYETCIKIADYYLERNKVDKLPAVVLATGKDFPDALTGAYLANVNHAPIMLIDSTSQTVITTYIKNHLASNGTVYVLGGTGAVDDSWIADLSGYNVKRMDGLNRFETNLSILKESGVKGGDIFVCTGLNYADSLSASGIDMPILIVGASLREDQKAYLAGGTWNFHLVGGDTVVTTDVENQLKAYGTIADRTYGSDRFATSKAMAEKFVGETHEAVLAYGANFPDGLCGGPLAYTMGSPIILSGSTPAQNTSGIAYTTGKNISSGLVLGGPALIDDQTVRTTFSMRESDQIKIYEE